MELLERFKETLKDSKITELEMSWTFRCSSDDLKLILEGKKSYTNEQELIMFRFILKERKIRSAFQVMEDFFKGEENIATISKEDVEKIVGRIEREHAKVLGSKQGKGNYSLETHSGVEIIVTPSSMYKDGHGALFLSANDYEAYRNKSADKPTINGNTN